MLKQLKALGAERFVSLLLITFSVAEIYAALQLSMTEEFTLGPGALPLIYASGLLIFSCIMGLTPTEKEPAEESAPNSASIALPTLNYRDGLITFILVALFISSIYFVGFLGGTIIFSLLYVLLISKWPIPKAAAFALVWGGAVYFGFDHLLGVQLEPGILFGG